MARSFHRLENNHWYLWTSRNTFWITKWSSFMQWPAGPWLGTRLSRPQSLPSSCHVWENYLSFWWSCFLICKMALMRYLTHRGVVKIFTQCLIINNLVDLFFSMAFLWILFWQGFWCFFKMMVYRWYRLTFSKSEYSLKRISNSQIIIWSLLL